MRPAVIRALRNRAPLVVALLLCWARSSGAGTSVAPEAALLKPGTEALQAWRTEEARRCAEEILQKDPQSAEGLNLLAHVAFMEGDYAGCREKLAALKRAGAQPPEELASIMEKLRPVHDAFQERETANFRFRWSNATDGILAEYAPPALESALAGVGRALDYRHSGPKIVVEIYPDIQSLSVASTLSVKDIETSGAVAICQFNRLMLASPRVFLQGYRWCDTLTHELTHYIIIKKTANRFPVWLHEGIAKRCEKLWIQGEQGPALGPLQSTLLAEALENDHFITFERMSPSLAKLDTQEEVALAFAEVESFVQFLEQLKGPAVIPELLNLVSAGSESEAALEKLTATPFAKLQKDWLQSLRSRQLVRIPGLRLLPLKVNQGRDNTERVSDLSGLLPEGAFRFVRLGDMLRDEGAQAAAALEYGRAVEQAGYVSPHLYVRLANAQIQSRDYEHAGQTLDTMSRYYPDYLPLHVALAELRLGLKDKAAAASSLEEAIRINPYDPLPHETLIGLYAESGNTQGREREERALRAIYEWLNW